MKLTALLAAFTGLCVATANTMPAGLAANPIRSLLKRAHLRWDPPTAYRKWTGRKRYWEHRCQVAYHQAGCIAGVVHQGESTMIKPNGVKTSFINAEGSSSMDMKNSRKMHIFDDDTYEEVDDWTWKNRKAMLTPKRRRKERKKSLGSQELEGQDALLLWNPVNAYKNHRFRKAHWERTCKEALIRENCRFGIIHKGETRLTRNGEETSYVNVEGSPSVDMTDSKKMRVYQDASTEDFTKDGWTKYDQRSIANAKYPWGPWRKRRPEPSQDHSKHSISWDPPHAYLRFKPFRKASEQACLKALEREGCDYGIIHKGQHHQGEVNPDGRKIMYLVVAAGNHDDPGGKRYMRLFEDGSSVWYQPGPLPKKDSRGVNHRLSAPYRRRKGPPQKQKGTLQAQGASTSTQASTEEHTQDSSKRRRVGGDEYQYSATQAHTPGRFEAPGGLDLNSPPAQAPTRAESPDRPNGRGGRNGFDLNLPPAEAASPE